MRPLIETDRLQLRLPEPEEIPEVIRFYTENQEHLRPWSPTFPQEFLGEPYWRVQVTQRQADHDAGAAERPSPTPGAGPTGSSATSR